MYMYVVSIQLTHIGHALNLHYRGVREGQISPVCQRRLPVRANNLVELIPYFFLDFWMPIVIFGIYMCCTFTADLRIRYKCHTFTSELSRTGLA